MNAAVARILSRAVRSRLSLAIASGQSEKFVDDRSAGRVVRAREPPTRSSTAPRTRRAFAFALPSRPLVADEFGYSTSIVMCTPTAYGRPRAAQPLALIANIIHIS